MKVKVSAQWFRERIIRNETGKIRELREFWYEILNEHDWIGELQFEVKDEDGNLLGVRVGFFDERLEHNKLYCTVTPGNYEMIGESNGED